MSKYAEVIAVWIDGVRFEVEPGSMKVSVAYEDGPEFTWVASTSEHVRSGAHVSWTNPNTSHRMHVCIADITIWETP